MDINRSILKKLKAWKESPGRKPLILQGSRQVGKTWLLKHFGKTDFEHLAYFNFDKQQELKQFFTVTKDPKRIIEYLSLVSGVPIRPETTLIVLDEVQECNEALNSLKYFNEEFPEYVIACAGSLLGVALSRGASFPVGKVEFLQVFPVSFSEFLEAADNQLFNFLESINTIEPIPDLFFSKLTDKLKMYLISGGMPEAILTLLRNLQITETDKVLQSIINSYRLDFSKHVDNKDVARITFIWDSLPSQLSRENKKFLFQTIKPGARAREYEDALQWLINAGLCYKIYNSLKPGFPLSGYDDLSAFKIYMNDPGLLRRMSLLDPGIVVIGNRLFSEFKGALTENYTLNSLVREFDGQPRYWKSNNLAEVDFLLQYQNMIIPIEVKSDENIRSKSLTFYRKSFQPPISIRYSLRNLKLDSGLLNIPLFMADYTKKLLGIC
jgi:predicted AAA+ superfamily ATPase